MDDPVRPQNGISVGDQLHVVFAGGTNQPPSGVRCVCVFFAACSCVLPPLAVYAPPPRPQSLSLLPSLSVSLVFVVCGECFPLPLQCMHRGLLCLSRAPLFAPIVPCSNLSSAEVLQVLSFFTTLGGPLAPASLGTVEGRWASNASTLVVTVLSLDAASPADRTSLLRFHVALAGTSGLRSANGYSQPAHAGTPNGPVFTLAAGSWGDWDAPRIRRVQVYDFSATVGVAVGDLVTVEFDQVGVRGCAVVFCVCPFVVPPCPSPPSPCRVRQGAPPPHVAVLVHIVCTLCAHCMYICMHIGYTLDALCVLIVCSLCAHCMLLVCWCSGVLVFWCAGVLVCWCAGVLVCCGAFMRGMLAIYCSQQTAPAPART